VQATAFGTKHALIGPWQTASLVVSALIASATLVAGGAAIVLHMQPADEHVLAPAGVLLLLSSAGQARILYAAYRSRRAAYNRLATIDFWRWMLVVGSMAYLGALAIGPVDHIAWAWLAAVAIGYTLLLLLPFAAAPSMRDGRPSWLPARFGRRVAWLMPALVLVAVVAEGGLRLYRFTHVYDSASATANDNDKGGAPPAVQRLAAGPFRVAVASSCGGFDSADYLARVQQRLPGLEIVPIELAQPRSAHLADVAAKASAEKADLLLAVLPVCEAAPRMDRRRSLFNWRDLELGAALGSMLGASSAVSQPEVQTVQVSAGDDFESFLDRLAPKMAACRAPQDERMRAHWQQTFESFEALMAACRERQLPLALVLVPGPFQVNPKLAETLARRQGMAGQVDLDLPQRKWAGFAEPRELPFVDLLPTLRLCAQSAYQRNAEAWNDTGNAAAAAAISGWLESRYGHQLSGAAQLTKAP
jgi:hypothetical protein